MVLKERLEEGWIHCSIIIELLGKPKEYAEQVMEKVVDAIGKIKGVEIVKKDTHEPKEAKNDLFSTFTEMELAVKDLNILTVLIFSYMPSNIEILAPAELKMPLTEINSYINMLASRLHGYDSLAKKLRMENMVLKNRLRELGLLPDEVKEPEELETITKEDDKK